MNLPNDFINEMKSLLGEEYINYYNSLSEEKHTGIRINTNKISIEDFLNTFPYKLNKIPFISNGFYVENTDAVSKHPYYYAGLYYIQEPSAMIPASLFDISPNDKVLDLCAAPGGKATEIISQNPALLYANDISYSRTIPLAKNLELFGAKNYYVTAETPEKLSNYFSEYFDKIIVDAPCSGEGMFRKDPSLINSWIEKRPLEYTNDQFNILNHAINMLKPGGLLLYSTCTFSICEDEEIIGKAIKSNPNIELLALPKQEGFSDGYLLNDYPDINFKNCIRIFPHLISGEGHFVACLKKKNININSDESISGTYNKNSFTIYNSNKYSDSFKEFLKFLDIKKDEKIFINDNRIYLLNESSYMQLKKGLRYTRTGRFLGEIKTNGFFNVNSGFALSLEEKDFSNSISFDSNDERVIKYLKGETIFIDEQDSKLKKGFAMICVDHFPLGFAKFDGIKFKNLYPQGWRYNA